MNAFEDIVRLFLEAEGYWVRQSVKVNISKEAKRALKLYSMPRPEIDLVALSVEKNELLLIEVKSYLYSQGVYYDDVAGKDERVKDRYRLFTNEKFRDVVKEKLREEYLEQGLINEKTTINYALAAGNIHSGEESRISKYFSENGWKLFSPRQIKDKLKELSERGGEDNPVTITAKLISTNDK
jgi:hypothetical protein